jgi:hypothetical protein
VALAVQVDKLIMVVATASFEPLHTEEEPLKVAVDILE